MRNRFNFQNVAHLISGQAEYDGGSLPGPVDHQVEMGVVQVKHRTIGREVEIDPVKIIKYLMSFCAEATFTSRLALSTPLVSSAVMYLEKKIV